MTPDPDTTVSVTDIADALAARAAQRPFLIGVTGSVAVGKSTFCHALAVALEAHAAVTILSTDGFLKPNRVLEAEGLTLKKGFPESYDDARLQRALADLRQGEARVPVYSHVTYDIDETREETVTVQGIALIEGLGLGNVSNRLDLSIYLDALEEDLEHWFIERFMRLWHAADHDEASFYRNFRHMSEPEAEAFGRTVWARINLPNLREHIAPARETADIILLKTRNHGLSVSRWNAHQG